MVAVNVVSLKPSLGCGMLMSREAVSDGVMGVAECLF
jgi:hypothetical protein